MPAPLGADAAAASCLSGHRSDFNGDGYTDAVVGDPYAVVAGRAQAGQVVVMYGDADGRIGEGRRGFTRQGSGRVGGVPEDGDHFGQALSVADLDCDGYTDLVVGVYGEDVGSVVEAGMVQIVWGAAAGLGKGRQSRNLTAASFGMPIEKSAHFGAAVDALEDDADGGIGVRNAYALAIGVPGGTVSGHAHAGWVALQTGDGGGSSSSVVTQDSPGMPGAAEAGDAFGVSVAIGYLAGAPGVVDVAVGAPFEDLGIAPDAGSVTIVKDVDDRPAGGVAFTQRSPRVPGSPEGGDLLGWSLDAVRVPGTSISWLAVGVPKEEPGAEHGLNRDCGMVQLFRAHRSGSQTVLEPATGLSQDTEGVAGRGEYNDQFGAHIALGVFGGTESSVRLAVGAQYKHQFQGQVQLFPITRLSAEATYTQASLSLPGTTEGTAQFGSAVSLVAGSGEQALLIGVPQHNVFVGGIVDVVPLGGGAPRAWVPGVGGVAGEPIYFGTTLGGTPS
jgi:hypothetical protein